MIVVYSFKVVKVSKSGEINNISPLCSGEILNEMASSHMPACFCHATEQRNPTKLSLKLASTLKLSRIFTLTPARIHTCSHSHLSSIHPQCIHALIHSLCIYHSQCMNACMHPSIQNASIQRSPFRINPFTVHPPIRHPCTYMRTTRMWATIHACIHRSCMHSPILQVPYIYSSIIHASIHNTDINQACIHSYIHTHIHHPCIYLHRPYIHPPTHPSVHHVCIHNLYDTVIITLPTFTFSDTVGVRRASPWRTIGGHSRG